ncbi:mucin-1-like [Procambarus clarkii]|uniref:mucin-1-like n=1 Tax=Procambarus clarkii TaxID=6728 RepID=UPI003743F860
MVDIGAARRCLAARLTVTNTCLRQRRVFPQGQGSRMSKAPRLDTPLTKPPSFAPPALKTVGADLAYPPPYLAPLPPPYPSHHKDAHQTFVDYLWGTRGSLPPLGLPYPLAAWPRRPLPSFPPLPLPDPRSDPTSDPRPTDAEPPALRPAHLSAFTPVTRASPTPTGSTGRDSGAPLPDSSRHSDDETVDIEATDDDADHKSDGYKSDSYKHELYKSEAVKPDSYKPSSSTKHHSLDTDHYKSDSYKPDDLRSDHGPGEAEVEESSRVLSRQEDRTHKEDHARVAHVRVSSPVASSSTNSLETSRPIIEIPSASSDSPTSAAAAAAAAAEEDPRLRLFLLREVEARRRVEQEMARLKYTYTSHLHQSLHHTLHHSLHTALQPGHHLTKVISPADDNDSLDEVISVVAHVTPGTDNDSSDKTLSCPTATTFHRSGSNGDDL